MGYRVITVPEAATLLREGGVNIDMSQLDKTQQIMIELRILKLQMALEDIYTEIAERCTGNVVVLCNTGVVDSSAYVSKEIWQAILDELGVTQVHLRDFRYDAVIHLVTSAQGAEHLYSRLDKISSIEEARNVDKLLQDAYTGHPKFSIISNENGQSFEDKLQKVTDIVFNTLNIKAVKQYAYKLLVKVLNEKDSIPIIPEYIKSQKIYVEETFIESGPSEVIRVQKRGHNNSYNYLHTIDKTREDGTIESASKIISPRVYMNYLEKRDKSRNTVKRLLQCFIQDDDYMILDTFLNIKFKGSLLRVETKKLLEDIAFPDFIEIERNVKVVVADTFKETSNDPNNDVMILFYIEKNQENGPLMKLFERVAYETKKQKNLLFYKFDLSKNEYEGLTFSITPAMVYYPRNDKSGKPYTWFESKYQIMEFIRGSRREWVY